MLVLTVLLGLASAATPSDYEVTSLPGLATQPSFKHYAGFLEATPGVELFFWFVESQRSPSQDPVALWLNGGPGSSSVAYGFWTEHGPFRLADNGTKVVEYEHSWNKVSNVLYVEAPAGVGLSWAKDPAHYKTNDTQASADNYAFLLNFFDVFTQFSTNDFYLTGESYGGHYIPTLAERVIDGSGTTRGGALFARTKGFWIGNPGINSDWYYNIDEYAFQTYLYTHALLPQSVHQKSIDACGWDEFYTNCKKDFTKRTPECKLANDEALKFVPHVWDPYNIYAPTCHEKSDARDLTSLGTKFVERNTPALAALRERLASLGIVTSYDPCISRQTPVYMTNPDVLKAIHASAHPNPRYPGDRPGWEYGEETDNIALLFPKFFSKAPHWKITVVSGDADAAVPFLGTLRWMQCLNRPVRKDWRHWMMNEDVAGSVMEWDGISFVSVKGCGHTIPTYCPEAGFAMWENYLNDSF